MKASQSLNNPHGNEATRAVQHHTPTHVLHPKARAVHPPPCAAAAAAYLYVYTVILFRFNIFLRDYIVYVECPTKSSWEDLVCRCLTRQSSMDMKDARRLYYQRTKCRRFEMSKFCFACTKKILASLHSPDNKDGKQK